MKSHEIHPSEDVRRGRRSVEIARQLRGVEVEDLDAMQIVFIGPPGAGKGTQSARLLKYLQVPHLSTGEVLRQAKREGTQLGLLAAKYIDQGRLAPDPLVVSIVGETLERPEYQVGCLFDGFPRTVGQAVSLEEYLRQRQKLLHGVLLLFVDEEELVRRLSGRSAVENRVDDSPDTIRTRLEVYRRETEPVLEFYRQRNLLHVIDGMGTQDEVFARIQVCVDNLKKKFSGSATGKRFGNASR